MLVVNASNTPKDFDWARARAQGAVRVENRSDDYALLAVQGPRAPAIVARVSASDPSDLPYYAFRTTEVLGKSALVSRTGYTGEDGFELYLAPEAAEEVFRGLLDAGRPEGIVPCGLGARDTLRLEAKMALYGNDIDDTVTPWEADLGWIVKMGKGDFLGRDALAAQKAAGVPRKLVGFEMVDRGIARHGWPIAAIADDSSFPELFEHLRAQRKAWGVELIPWRNLRELYGWLKRKEILGLIIDWGYRADDIPVRMFGAWTTLPAGPAALAAKTGSPIVHIAIRRSDDQRRFIVTYGDPIIVASTEPAEIQRATQAIADALAATIAAAPEQWYSFKALWPTTEAEQAALAERASTVAPVPAGS